MPGTPVGTKLTDGYPTFGHFVSFPTLSLWIKELSPLSFIVGGEDTTGLDNVRYRTQMPHTLAAPQEARTTAAYDPLAYAALGPSVLGVNDWFVVRFPDLSQICFRGWLDEFRPGACKDGEMPVAECVVKLSNEDVYGNEVGPFYVVPPSQEPTPRKMDFKVRRNSAYAHLIAGI